MSDTVDLNGDVVTETAKAEVKPSAPETDELLGETESESETDDAEHENGEKPKHSKVQARINELTRKMRIAERERDFALSQLQQSSSRASTDTAKPTLEQFDYDQEAYIDALADYKLQQHLSKSKETEANTSLAQENARIQAQFKSREQQIRATYPDYDAVAYNQSNPITPTMATAIQRDEAGALVAYYLGKNPDVAFNITQLSTREQYTAIGDLSDKIQEYQAKKAQTIDLDDDEPAQVNVSKAPSPPPKVKSTGSARPKSPEALAQSDNADEWMEWRRKDLASKRR